MVAVHLTAVFKLVEKFTQDLEEQDFTKKAIDSIISLASKPRISEQVLSCIFRGLESLLMSLWISHSLREKISRFFVTKLQSWTGALSSLNFMLTCTYSAQFDSQTAKSKDS